MSVEALAATQPTSPNQRESNVPRPLSLVQLPHLRVWRLKSERTQFDVAREAGVGMSTVTRAEKGDYITALNAQKIARALGVSVKQLQEEEPGS